MRSCQLSFLLALCQFPQYTCYDKVWRKNASQPSDNKNCKLVSNTLTCKEIPVSIPDQATDVLVTNHVGEMKPAPFIHPSWKHVQTLELCGQDATTIQRNQFCGLDHMTELVLRFYRLLFFTNDSFACLQNLRVMTMFDLHHVTDAMTKSLVAEGILPSLVEFIIHSGYQFEKPRFHATKPFMSELFYKPLTMVNISNTEIHVSVWTMLTLLVKLDVVNISGSTIVITDPISNSVFVPLDNTMKPLLQTFDISKSIMPLKHTTSHNFENKSTKVFNVEGMGLSFWIRNMENIFADQIPDMQWMNFKHVSLTASHAWLKRLFLRGNNLQRLNFSMSFNNNNTFELLDLSNNKLEFVAPGMISTATNLREIYLSKNNLGTMEALPEFLKFFVPLEKLEILDLSSNNISYIPWRMFEENHNIRVLNLSGNLLGSIMFNLSGLARANVLDLRKNKIQYIRGRFLNQLKHYVDNQRKYNNVHILLQGNPIECACDNLDFIKWLSSYIDASKSPYGQTCKYEGSYIGIDEHAVRKVEFLCRRTLVIAVSTVCSVLGIAAFVVVIVFWRIRKKTIARASLEERFKTAFLSGRLEYSYLVFVSYASADEDIVVPGLLPKIMPKMKIKLGSNVDVVSTGDNFRPGFPIADEAFEAIRASCVFMAVVSESFCQSNYCLAEIREACNQQRPIILIFIGHVDETKMTPYMKEVFRRYVRGKMIKTCNGNYVMTPSAEELCESILALAIDDAEKHGPIDLVDVQCDGCI